MHPRIRKVRLLRRLRRLTRIRSLVRNENGIQLAELAIVLPLLLVMFAATAEFGRYFYEYTTLAKASRVAARYLVTANVNCFQANQARNLVVYGNMAGTGSPLLEGLTTANVKVTPNDLACSGGIAPGVPDTITVQIIDYQHQSLFDLGGLMKNSTFSLNVPVKPSVTMRYLLTSPLV
jgi:hypothetical protein